MVAYKDRLAEAIRLAGVDIHQLVEALGLSYTAVKKVLDGGTNSLTAHNNSVAAKFLKVDPDWLATGDGTPRAERVWPFKSLSPEQWHSVSLDVREAAEKMLRPSNSASAPASSRLVKSPLVLSPPASEPPPRGGLRKTAEQKARLRAEQATHPATKRKSSEG